ncbi:MAG TPA: ATP-dependent DNA helicase [Acidimicrobiales bacterium]|nr:ATP-dependent DNA helicase [Acidimicrobiales bacterium]
MELTAAQGRIVEHDGGPLRISGGAGSGKTTALVHRYLRLVDDGHRPSSILVTCRDRAAATRFRNRILPRLSGGFDALPITTWFGVAFDLVTRARGPVRLLSTSEQRVLVRRLLAGESPGDWPKYGHFLGRQAFADEVAAALLDVAPGASAELDRFACRYESVLAERGEIDRSRLLSSATALAAEAPGRYAHVLVDDHDAAQPAVQALLAAVAGGGAGATVVSPRALPWPAVDVELTEAFRHPAPPVLVTCRHPSTEPEAVAGELLAARAEGVAWSSMAVLVRSPQRQGRSIARALSRHGIPVAPGPGLGTGVGDPAVAAIIDVLRWAAGDEGAPLRLEVSPLSVLGADALTSLRDDVAAHAGTATPAALAFSIWERGLGHLVGGPTGDEVSLDAVVAFLDRLQRRVEHDPSERLPELLSGLDDGELTPDPWRTSAGAGDPAAVTITSISAAAGREWHTVVVAGCVEGQLPRIRARAPLFDPAPVSPAERRQASLAQERLLFLTACSRATSQLIATAAPEPGVLLSRFVEAWAPRESRPPAFGGPAPTSRRPTENPVAVFPDGRLVLSASQLATYDDCPLRYAYQYGLRVRDDAGAPAALGSLVHEVLAEFLRPDRTGDRTREALLAIAAEHWRDDIARYRPQVEECRRDYFSMLETWWAAEGENIAAVEVFDVERRFQIEVGDVHLVGAIDRVDRTVDGEGLRIIDYKTGRHEPRPDSMPDDLQLAVYHLAATRDPVLAAAGSPRQLELVYVRTMNAFEQPILTDHAEATEERVLSAAEDIRHEHFEPSVDASCRNCSFHRLCPMQREGREVGAG